MQADDSPVVDEALLSDLRARRAEVSGGWHLAVLHLRTCLDRAEALGDDRAVRRYAARLSLAYRAMGMDGKAGFYRLLAG